MIKELWSHFEFGGRNLLCRNKQHRIRSRRQLHYAFWSHAALQIPLPAWWTLLLQTPVTDSEYSLDQSAGRHSGVIASQIRGLFLDFLHPLCTLARIRSLQYSTAAHQAAARRIRRRSRSYNTIAATLIAQSNADTLTRNQNAQASRVVRPPDLADDVDQELDEILNTSVRWRCHDRLWSLYERCRRRGYALSPSQIVTVSNRLSISDRVQDSKRLLELFNRIPTSERCTIHYSHAIIASLKTEEYETAICAHREATTRHVFSAGASSILRHAVTKSEWEKAIHVTQLFSGGSSLDSPCQDIWADLRHLPFNILVRRSVAAIDTACRRRLDENAIVNMMPQGFLVDMARTTFEIRGKGVNLVHWRSLVAALLRATDIFQPSTLSELQAQALSQLISLRKHETTTAAANAYMDFRCMSSGFRCPEWLIKQMVREWHPKVDYTILEKLMEDWRHVNGSLDLWIFRKITSIFSACGYADEVRKIFDLYRAEHQKNGHLDPSTCQNLLHVYFRRADPDGAVQSFRDLAATQRFTPHTSHYNTVLATFARVGDVKGANSWLEKLEEDGFQPNAKTYTTLMQLYSKRGDEEMVEFLCKEMRSKGIRQDIAMHDSSVLARINNGKLDDAERSLESALRESPPDQLTNRFNLLLSAHAQQGDLQKVKNLHNRMREAKVPSNGLTYGAIVAALSRARLPSAAYSILAEVMPKVGIQPTSLHYAFVMASYLQMNQYQEVFSTYDQMLKQGIVADVNSKLILLRSAACVDRQRSHSGAQSAIYPRALKILEEITSSLDLSELATLGPYKSVGFQHLNEAWISTYFEIIIKLHGATGAFDVVGKSFETFVRVIHKFTGRDIESSPPMLMVATLLEVHKNAKNFDQVERCWYLALDKCEELTRKASVPGVPRSSWVLASRRFIINFPLRPYMSYLADVGKFDEMVDVVTDLLDAGYELNGANLNRYVQNLCRSSDCGHQLMAFSLCEKLLMPGWKGWEAIGSMSRLQAHFSEMIRAAAGRAPTYRTLVWLAKAYVDLGFGRARWKSAEAEKLQRNGDLSRTLDAVANLPALGDQDQRTILRQGTRMVTFGMNSSEKKRVLG